MGQGPGRSSLPGGSGKRRVGARDPTWEGLGAVCWSSPESTHYRGGTNEQANNAPQAAGGSWPQSLANPVFRAGEWNSFGGRG